MWSRSEPRGAPPLKGWDQEERKEVGQPEIIRLFYSLTCPEICPSDGGKHHQKRREKARQSDAATAGILLEVRVTQII